MTTAMVMSAKSPAVVMVRVAYSLGEMSGQMRRTMTRRVLKAVVLYETQNERSCGAIAADRRDLITPHLRRNGCATAHPA